VAAVLTLFPAVWGQAEGLRDEPHSKPFSRIFVFGDSLSDTGNFYQLSGGTPPAPYYQGRFSNGRVWVEQLADALGMTIAPGDNYAVGGATTGFVNYNDGLNGRDYPGLLDETGSFRATRDAAEAHGALFVVWTGANDFFLGLRSGQTPAEIIGNGVGNTVQAIQQLRQAGARHIMVVNLPDLGLTPEARAANLGAGLTQLSAAYNQVLDLALDSLASAGIPTIRVDAFAALRKMVAQPAQFAFTNVTDPLMYVGGNAAEFLFWDGVHPTTNGHAVFAEAAADSLVSYFSPRQGKGIPAARVNCLNGLVNAWDNH
jgi:phospholipase/lecithinase/hemolysin